ncbi:MAG: methyltransferase domain-containing protein [Candidatus Bathyarchaeia archaeon]
MKSDSYITLDELYLSLKDSPFTTNHEMFYHVFKQDTLVRIRETLKLIPKSQGGEDCLVDVGCYAPMISLYQKICGYKKIIAVGKDDWDLLSKSHEALVSRRELDLKIIICDLERSILPIEDRSVNTVLMLETLEHFSIDPMGAMAEINRILKYGGKLIISTPNAINIDALVKVLLGDNPQSEPYNGVDTNRHNRFLYS